LGGITAALMLAEILAAKAVAAARRAWGTP